MGPHVVVVDPPAFDGPGLGERGEDLLVQALVAQAAVEAFNEAILLGLARRDVIPEAPLSDSGGFTNHPV
jgi:hypothetical protein